MGIRVIRPRQLAPSLPGLLAIAMSLVPSFGCAKLDALKRLDAVFLAPPSSDGITVNFCTDPAVVQKYVTKMVVVLDHSGSNKMNYKMASDGSGAPALINGQPVISASLATDPTGHLRYGDINTPGTLLNFLYTTPANDPANPSRYFALVDFSDNVTTYPPNNSGFTPDVQAFYNYVQNDAGGVPPNQSSPNDAGATSYVSALGAVYNIINGDVTNAQKCSQLPVGTPSWNYPPGLNTNNCPNPGVQVTSAYVIVFMSDGSPITQISGIGVDSGGNFVTTGPIQLTKEPSNQILGQVGSIMGLTANTRYVAGINLFTVYYYFPGNIDVGGQSLLGDMAKVGNGIAYNALSGSNIDYSRFVPPAKSVKFALSDVLVTNSSVVWWSDGKPHADTDMDGLPDDIELAWGSDPNQVDTNGNGVSDLVEYQLSSTKTCANKGANGICLDAAINYAAGACAGVSHSTVNGKVVFQASDPSGLNDCEKILLSDIGGINSPDSNGDLIPDWLEFKNGVPFQLGTSAAVNSPSMDGWSIYQKIKSSLPAMTPVYQYLNLEPASYNLTILSTSDVQDCYKLVVSGLPIQGDQNTVRVDVILKSQLLQDRYLYRTAQKKFPLGSKSLLFNDWNDAGEKAANTWRTWP